MPNHGLDRWVDSTTEQYSTLEPALRADNVTVQCNRKS